MNAGRSKQPNSPMSDPIVDEVRAIRSSICEEFGNDVDRLCDHLQEVEREYRERTGRFADLFTMTSEQVVAGWGDEVNDLSDPIVDDVREIRRKLADKP